MPASVQLTEGAAPPALRRDRTIHLLGEVHDNAFGHALRLAAFDQLLARGARPALVMEQFDQEDQPVLDALTRRQPTPTADDLLAAVRIARGDSAAAGQGGGPGGWDWALYQPYLERALRHGLPLVAGNVGRAQARRIMREGLAAHGFDPDVPADVLAGLARLIEASHCGQVDNAQARRMALAQVARDQQMARAVAQHAARGVVLLAGNGHVRNDLGVPRWLGPNTRPLAQSVGFIEPAQGNAPTAAAGAFDLLIALPPQPRPDPCAALPATISAPPSE